MVMVVHCQLRRSEELEAEERCRLRQDSEELEAEERWRLRQEGASAAVSLLQGAASSDAPGHVGPPSSADGSSSFTETEMIARSASAAHTLAVVARYARINKRAGERHQRQARRLQKAADRAAPVVVCSSCSTTSLAETVMWTSPAKDMASMCLHSRVLCCDFYSYIVCHVFRCRTVWLLETLPRRIQQSLPRRIQQSSPRRIQQMPVPRRHRSGSRLAIVSGGRRPMRGC